MDLLNHACDEVDDKINKTLTDTVQLAQDKLQLGKFFKGLYYLVIEHTEEKIKTDRLKLIVGNIS